MSALQTSPVSIREATSADLAAIAEIYRHYVEHTVATFDTEAPGSEQWLAKFAAITDAGRPFVVAVADQQVVGYAYLNTFRPMPGYDRTVEDTVYVRPGFHGRRVGTSLLTAVLERVPAGTVRQIVAVIAATGGEGSIALHSRFGFAETGRLYNVGFKADQWIDCVFMQKDLNAGN